MVRFFQSTATDPPTMIYVGRDKEENEDLIKHGWDEDVWFHVDKLSSAHVYLRMSPGMTWDNLPEALLNDCAQLVKANSIEGNKKDNISIIYTPWSNLKKTGAMDVGQVSYHNPKLVRYVKVAKRCNITVNRLNKTERIEFPDLRAQKEEHLNKLAFEKREHQRQLDNQSREQQRLAREEKERNSYDRLFENTGSMLSNKEASMLGIDLEEDFM
ncbi:hypothetical protein H696_03565 [Fonticula alba]|uniref:NFACT RNA-binding domain-containing protein n=1 Tax=Fonticula alba TaxID=691883 RepID=A0A058Z862_FONAL|nr:hypothetical protein H696_03565 [Fonticula alba]KCV70103.1 hypothetical protein H696_03565 [Fonticula alba]|eukprot:XP_009495709.1 hypothetical protein H696_03565 [Fonticula alba]